MTSNYAKNRGLSQETLSLWKSVGENPRDVTERLRFYLSYFPEVVPYGVTVHHVPGGLSSNTRQQIQFWLGSGKIFMSGLVAMEMNGVKNEHPAEDESYTKLYDEDLVRDDGTWRLFTAGALVRMYNCLRPNEYELTGLFHPIDDAWKLAAHLQREYDSMKKQ